MKPHPRIRKTIKWTGAAVTVLLVLVWVGSGWIEVAWKPWGSTHCLFAGSGIVETHEFTPHGNPASTYRWQTFAEFRTSPFKLEWFGTRQLGRLAAPLWPLTLAALGLTALAWRLDALARRRAKSKLCPKCNYDRTGLTQNAKCPECGAAPPSA